MNHSSKNKGTIVLLGSGNLATQLGLILKKKGYSIGQVYSPTPGHARLLANKLGALPVSSLKAVNKNADMYILAVKDDAIAQIASKLNLGDRLVIHTSGSIPMNALKPMSSSRGVLYPLQTFSLTHKPDWKTIPLCIEANTKTGETHVHHLAKTISSDIHRLNSSQRLQLHLAAVFAGNFSNHMYTLAEELMRKKKLPARLLHPLMRETTEKAIHKGAHAAQTGPAIRNDKQTMKKHLKALSGDKKKKEIYRLISKSIRKA